MSYPNGDYYEIDDGTLFNIVCLLSGPVRLSLFEALYQATGGRPLERIWQLTGIRKTDLYRYLPRTKSKKGGLTPSPKNTVKIIKALLKFGKTELVVNTLDPAASAMRMSYKSYFNWTKSLRKRNVVYNPLSHSEMYRIKKSLY